VRIFGLSFGLNIAPNNNYKINETLSKNKCRALEKSILQRTAGSKSKASRNSMSGKQINRSKIHRSHRGQSLMEMALLLPILLVLIIGGIEFGHLFYTKTIITNAAREGAYYLSINPSDYNPKTGSAPNTVMAIQAEANNSGLSNVTVSFTPKNCCKSGEYSISITVESTVENIVILGFLSSSLFDTTTATAATNSGDFTLTSTVEMMIQ